MYVGENPTDATFLRKKQWIVIDSSHYCVSSGSSICLVAGLTWLVLIQGHTMLTTGLCRIHRVCVGGVGCDMSYSEQTQRIQTFRVCCKQVEFFLCWTVD